MANTNIGITVDTKEIDRLAIGARLYDMLDIENINNKLAKGLTVSEETIKEMLKLVNKDYDNVIKSLKQAKEDRAEEEDKEYKLHITIGRVDARAHSKVDDVIKSYPNVKTSREDFFSTDGLECTVIDVFSSNTEELEEMLFKINWCGRNIDGKITELD